MLSLQVRTPPEWLDAVFSDFDGFLADHALCERKASAMGMSLVAKYPDRKLILEPLIAFAREELEHFHIMFKVLSARGLALPPDSKDAYVNGLRQLMHSEPEALFLDRLLVSSVVEARGCERLQLVTEALSDAELKRVYLDLRNASRREPPSCSRRRQSSSARCPCVQRCIDWAAHLFAASSAGAGAAEGSPRSERASACCVAGPRAPQPADEPCASGVPLAPASRGACGTSRA
jgi:tRNA-(ms[2]io[6]A)-hydroxylase